MWPTFSVAEILADGSPAGTVSFLAVGKETWVGDRHIGYLQLPDTLIRGRWYTCDRGWQFTPDVVANFSVGDTFSVFDGYWGERVLIAIDPTLTWSPAVWTAANDHDHCSICWATISTRAEPNYYTNSNTDSVCAICYRNHVSQRDISFVPVA